MKLSKERNFVWAGEVMEGLMEEKELEPVLKTVILRWVKMTELPS